MEEKLSKLYALQKVDSNLDELEELKGDLPAEVATLEARMKEQENRVRGLEDTIKQAVMDRDKADLDAISLKEKIEKYKTQQYQVKSNRQYDALSREIDAAQGMIVQLEKSVEALEGKMTVGREDLEKAKAQLEEVLIVQGDVTWSQWNKQQGGGRYELGIRFKGVDSQMRATLRKMCQLYRYYRRMGSSGKGPLDIFYRS